MSMSYQKTSEIELAKFAARLNEICNDKGMPLKFAGRQAALADVIIELTGEKISPKAARKWLEGEGFPSTDKMILLAKWAGVKSEWFLSGDGAKYEVASYNDPRIDHVLKIMQEMPEYKIDQAVRIIDTIAEPTPAADKKAG
jgi:transcriptional regulator with XRE-family HTH domain